LNGRFGFHGYKTIDISSIELNGISGSSKRYIYIPCRLLSSPKETEAALEIVYLSPDEALELKFKGEVKLMPTTSLVLALIKLGEFTL